MLQHYKKKKKGKKKYSSFILGGDIGGTNTKLGIFGVKNGKPVLLFLLQFKSQELKSAIPAIKKILLYAKEHKIKINNACLAVAGPVSANRDFCNLTYVKWNVDTKEIMKKTSLRAFLINDFEAIGYGINLLSKKDVFEVGHNRKALPKATKAIIGAGTGLGKCILVYNDKEYVPIPSAGGFSDFPCQNELELRLVNFIKKKEKIKEPISCEEMISGKGIESIYLFLRKIGKIKASKYTNEIDKAKIKVELISKYRKKDRTCREVFKFYTKFYARCAKNFVLEVLALGGLYIAGGIASKNKEIFRTKEFINEFEKVNQQPWILKKNPIYVIVNQDIGIYGAAYAAMKD